MRPFILWTILTVLLGALLYWKSGIGARELSYYAPDEYVERADQFIRKGYLVADCSSGAAVLRPVLGEAPEHERSWFNESYLAADVRRFNDDPAGFGWAFAVDDDCRLRGVNPVVHAVDLPFTRRIRWLGSILYNGERTDAVLRSAQRSITLRRSERPVPVDEQAATQVGSDRELFKEGTVLLHLAGGRGQPAARLFHVGDDLVVHNRTRRQSAESVRVMGHQLPVGMMARLESGDWLTVSGERPRPLAETFVFTSGEDMEAASRVRRQNERWQRRTEDPGLGLAGDPVRETTYPFLDLVARSVDAALAVLPEERANALSRGFDVQLTVERDAQLRLNEILSRRARRLIRDRGLAEPFAAGITVMDARNGGVLAMATFPHGDDLLSSPLAGAQRQRLLRNQNLLRHPIGSAGKPFLFAAIADAYPRLLSLTIAGHEEERYHRDVFHCRIPTGYQLLSGHERRIDFASALQVSCNKYTIDLLMLALAADLGGGEVALDRDIEWPPYEAEYDHEISGLFLRGAPDLGGYVFQEELPRSNQEPRRSQRADDEEVSYATHRCTSLDRFEQVRFRQALGDLTGAATYQGLVPQGLPQNASRRQLERGYTTNRYDLDPWRPLLEELILGTSEDSAWRIRAALQEISPERVNLAFNQVTRLRADLVSLALGGGTATWTNIQVAEAMARLTTGRMVEARLVADVPGRDTSEPTPADAGSVRLGLHGPARAAVLEGMLRVATGGGTASELADEIDAVEEMYPGDRIYLFSKTGSPVLEKAVPEMISTALERLVIRNRLRYANGRLEVHSGGNVQAYRRPGAGRDTYVAALRSAVGEVGYRTNGGYVTAVLRKILDEFMTDVRTRRGGELDGPLRLDGGVLRVNREDRLFRSRMVRQMGSVYIFSLVRVPAGVRWRFDDELPAQARAVSVALHLETGPDSRVAVGLAEEILVEVAALLK